MNDGFGIQRKAGLPAWHTTVIHSPSVYTEETLILLEPNTCIRPEKREMQSNIKAAVWLKYSDIASRRLFDTHISHALFMFFTEQSHRFSIESLPLKACTLCVHLLMHKSLSWAYVSGTHTVIFMLTLVKTYVFDVYFSRLWSFSALYEDRWLPHGILKPITFDLIRHSVTFQLQSLTTCHNDPFQINLTTHH